MLEHFYLWGEFVSLALVVVLAGTVLTRYADAVSEKLQLGRVFIGMIFLGFVTSLPEMVITLSSLVEVEQPDMGVGNIYGSCLFNLFMICLVDWLFMRGRVFVETQKGEAVCGLMSIVLVALSLAGLTLGGRFGGSHPRFFDPLSINFGITSFLILVVYGVASWVLYRAERMPRQEQTAPPDRSGLWRLLVWSGLAALAIVLAGALLTRTCDRIATVYGLGHSFVGTAFLAAISSMPELVCTFAAARLGSVGLAFGNIFGSNLFNIAILGITDAAWRKGLVFAHKTSDEHIVVGLCVVIVTAIYLVAGQMDYRARRRVGWVTGIAGALYVGGLAAAFFLSRL